jgi:hypothetical protein
MFLSRLNGIWPWHDLEIRFSYLEGDRTIEEAESLYIGLLTSRDGWLAGLG